jgi:Bacterial extracellular solute-binding protein, family 7
LLGVVTQGPGQMFARRPVAGIDDVQGIRIRTGGGIVDSVAKALGASAFVKSSCESYELLQSGVADGVFFPLESIVTFTIVQATLFPGGGLYDSAFGFFMASRCPTRSSVLEGSSACEARRGDPGQPAEGGQGTNRPGRAKGRAQGHPEICLHEVIAGEGSYSLSESARRRGAGPRPRGAETALDEAPGGAPRPAGQRRDGRWAATAGLRSPSRRCGSSP